MIGRRGFITGLVSLVAAPAIVRVGSLMPARAMVEFVPVQGVEWSGYAEGPITLAEYAQRRLNGLNKFRAAWWDMMIQSNEIIGDLPFTEDLAPTFSYNGITRLPWHDTSPPAPIAD